MAYDTEQTSPRRESLGEAVAAEETRPVKALTGNWGDPEIVSSYLDRCQVDTPVEVVRSIWAHVTKHRSGEIGKVLDLGAGDGRFAQHGLLPFIRTGYEIDETRCAGVAPTGRCEARQCVRILALD